MSRNKSEIQPFWRPNFVNQSELPDIKVIRTGFIINFIAVTVALCVAFFLLQREYRSYALGKTIDGMEQRIRVADADDVESLKLSERFRDSAEHIVEVESFFDSPLLIHEFLRDLASIKPAELIFNSIALTESVEKISNKNVIVYNINISGDAANLTVLDDFKKILSEDELLQLSDFDVEIQENPGNQNERTGFFPYRMEITLSPVEEASTPSEGEDES